MVSEKLYRNTFYDSVLSDSFNFWVCEAIPVVWWFQLNSIRSACTMNPFFVDIFHTKKNIVKTLDFRL